MRRKALTIGIVVGVIGLWATAGSPRAQQVHTEHEGHAAVAEEEHIFCPTMKTGQLCTHGTAATLGVGDDKNDQWVAVARKYNQAVNAATLELFKDAEGVLSPDQQELLKAWFAVGVNPEINQLLYKKGLGSSSQGR